jgi:hypothetical protein
MQVVERSADVLGGDGHLSRLDGGQDDVSAAGDARDVEHQRARVGDVGIVVEGRLGGQAGEKCDWRCFG